MYLGIDIGGMSIKAGLVNDNGEILAKRSIKTNVGNPEQTIEDIAQLCFDTAKEGNVDFSEIKAIGSGVPGTAHNGNVSFAANIGWYNVPYCQRLSQLTGKPCFVANDANCALLGEWYFGVAKGYSDVVAITIGTGVGLAVITDGRMLLGNGSAGTEGGHIRVKERGLKCACGRHDCWELYASTSSLLRRAEAIANQNPDGIIAKIIAEKGLNGFTVFEAEDSGDKQVSAMIDEYIDDIVEGLVSYVNIFRPEVIVLGGGISMRERIVSPLEEKVNALAYGGKNNPYVYIKTARFFNDAGIIGAAALAIKG